MNQRLAYLLLRDAGVPAPRTAYVELWMNGEYRGLYLNVEAADEAFLERWFEHPDGNLYEGAYGVDLRPRQVGDFDQDVVGEGDVTDRSDLLEVSRFLAKEDPTDEDMAELERRLDLDEWLRAMAVEALIGHWDGYYHRNNYRVYHDPVLDRWTLLPWGTDQTFRQDIDPWAMENVVGRFCSNLPLCARRYDQALLEVADRREALDCQERVEEVWGAIEPLYAADPYAERTPEQVEVTARKTVGYCPASVARVRGWLE